MNTVIKLELTLSDYYSFDASPENPDLATTTEDFEEYASAQADELAKRLRVWLANNENTKRFGVATVSECVGEVAGDCPEMQAARDFEAKLNEERMREAI